jgi:hypothetical protein
MNLESGCGALLPRADLDVHRRTPKTEVLAQSPLHEPYVLRVELPAGEQRERGRAGVSLRAEQDARLLAPSQRVGMGCGDLAEERARSAYACESRTIVTRRPSGPGKDWNDALQAWLRSKS